MVVLWQRERRGDAQEQPLLGRGPFEIDREGRIHTDKDFAQHGRILKRNVNEESL